MLVVTFYRMPNNPQPKNIILCSDGTGNTAIKGRGTNVFKLYEALDIQTERDGQVRQVAFYDDGIGSQGNVLLRGFSGAFGFGFGNNVRELYLRLVRAYNPGDHIYVFGFSRGAFTVRVLAGMIARQGILDWSRYTDPAELTEHIRWLYNHNKKTWGRAPLEILFLFLFKSCFFFLDRHKVEKADVEEKKQPINPGVKFIGVWDTVDAIGMPIVGLGSLIDAIFVKFKFKEPKLHERVERACHAISIDDERDTFRPVLWKEMPSPEKIEQVWFPGVHTNVGGGYPKQGMSLVSLHWMMEKVREKPNAPGLLFIPSVFDSYKDRQDPFDKLYDSRAGLGYYYRYLPRHIAKLSSKHEIKNPKIHVSAWDRVLHGVDWYGPANLPADFELVATGGKPVSQSLLTLQQLYRNKCKQPNEARGKQPENLCYMDMFRGLIHFRQASHWGVIVGGILGLIAAMSWLIEGLKGNPTPLFWIALLVFSAVMATIGMVCYFNIKDALIVRYRLFWHQLLVAHKEAIRTP